MALTDKLTAIANAIRGKTGGSASMTLDEMAAAITGLQTDGYKKSDTAYTLTLINSSSVLKGELKPGESKAVKGNYLKVSPYVNSSRHMFISDDGALLVSYKEGGISAAHYSICILNMSDTAITLSNDATLDYTFYEYTETN